MDFDMDKKTVDRMQQEITARADAEARETASLVQDPTKALNTKLNLKVAEYIDKSPTVEQKIGTSAEKLVDVGLQSHENQARAEVVKSESSILDAEYEKNKAEYLYHGIDHKVDKKWKKTFISVTNDIWFIILGLASFFTIVPISMFMSRIKALRGFVKGVAVVIGIISLITILLALTRFVLAKLDIKLF